MADTYIDLDLEYAKRATVQYVVPVAAATVTVDAGTDALILEPAGTLATLTIALPGSPGNGKKVIISSTAAVTSLTVSGGTLATAISSLAAGTPVSICFYGTKWYKC